MPQALLDVRITQVGEFLTEFGNGTELLQAFFRGAELFDELVNEFSQKLILLIVQRVALLQKLAEIARFIAQPGLQGGRQFIAGDEVVLKGENTEQKIAVGCRHGAPAEGNG